jgi:curved DNA-binding protein CbpA
MSSPAAGKFQDHYKILGIDPKSTLDIIQLAYNALRDVYAPNGTGPNHEKFDEITLAIEVLSDPVGRKMFDSVRGGDDDRDISFSGMDFFNSLQSERDRRMTMLCVLYDVRRQNPRVPLITMRQFEKIVDMTEEQIQMALWYAKTLGWVSVDDKSKMQISAAGMDFLQANAPDPASIWPFLKNPSGPRPEAQVVTPTPAAVEPPPPPPATSPELKEIEALSTAIRSFGTPTPAPGPTLVSEDPKPKLMSLIRRTQIAITEA